MVRVVAVLTIAVLTLAASSTPRAGEVDATPLAAVVDELNRLAQEDATGMGEPALTEDEVIASIRGWVRELLPASDEVYKAYQKIADTRTLPEGAKLRFTTRWSGFNGHEFDVWWVDLSIATGPDTGYNFRVRDRKLRCRRIEP